MRKSERRIVILFYDIIAMRNISDNLLSFQLYLHDIGLYGYTGNVKSLESQYTKLTYIM